MYPSPLNPIDGLFASSSLPSSNKLVVYLDIVCLYAHINIYNRNKPLACYGYDDKIHPLMFFLVVNRVFKGWINKRNKKRMEVTTS